VGTAYGIHEDEWRPIGGVNIGFTEQITSLVNYDGKHVHPTLSWSLGRRVFTFLLVEGQHPGLSYSLTFAGPERWLRRTETRSSPITRIRSNRRDTPAPAK
jgi:hypothetical protein